MTESVDEGVVVKDVVCADEETEGLLEGGWYRHFERYCAQRSQNELRQRTRVVNVLGDACSDKV
jgi:hypothetical protein